MMTFRLLLLLMTIVPTTACGEDWPHWRGVNRNGNVRESSGWTTGKAWVPENPVWTTSVDAGGTGPIVVGNHVYTMGWRGGRDHVSCLDARTGKRVWRQSYDCPQYGRRSEGDKGLYSGPSSCPSYDDTTGYLYTLSTDGDLICWDTRKEGKRVWSVNFYDAYNVPRRPKVGRRSLRDESAPRKPA